MPRWVVEIITPCAASRNLGRTSHPCCSASHPSQGTMLRRSVQLPAERGRKTSRLKPEWYCIGMVPGMHLRLVCLQCPKKWSLNFCPVRHTSVMLSPVAILAVSQ
ncbi:unnamed protein product, partial [Ixodes pacificus]